MSIIPQFKNPKPTIEKPFKWLPVDFGMVFPGGASGKEPACKAGDVDSIRGSGRSSGGGSGHPLQYSWLENPMDRGTWQAI